MCIYIFCFPFGPFVLLFLGMFVVFCCLGFVFLFCFVFWFSVLLYDTQMPPDGH